MSQKPGVVKFEPFADDGKPSAGVAAFEPLEDARPETTSLTDSDEASFRRWAKTNKIGDVDNPDSHYDYRGFWKEHGDQPVRFGVDHFPDTYKQHGHPTFSVESKYSKGAEDGGRWDGETFVPQGAKGSAARPAPVQVDRQFTSGVKVTGPAETFPPRMSAALSPQPSAPVRLGSAKTGGGATALQGTMPVLDAPHTGIPQAVHGARDAAVALFTPPADQPEPTLEDIEQQAQSGIVATPISDKVKAGLSDMIEGTFKTLEPVAVGAMISQPVIAAISLGAGAAASKAATAAVVAAGGSAESARLAGNLASAVAAVKGTDLIVAKARGMLNDAATVAARGRAHDAAYDAANPPPPTEPIPVGRGATEAAIAAKPKLEARNRSRPPSPEPGAPPPPPAPIDTTAAYLDLAQAAPNSPEALTAIAGLRAAGWTDDQITAAVAGAMKPAAAVQMPVASARVETAATPTAGPAPAPPAASPLSDVRADHVQRTIEEGLAAGVPDNPVAQRLEEERQAIERASAGTTRVESFEPLDVAEPTPMVADAPAVETFEPADAKDREFASTQFALPPTVGDKLQALGDTIPKKDLAPDGREAHPHVTVKFGLHGDDPDTVRELLADHPPITVTLGKTSVFPDSGNGDVVKVDVDSPELHALNAKIAKALKHTDTHPEYRPHATVAYVKPGKGKQYEGLDALNGEQFTVDAIQFSGKDGTLTTIPLGGKAKALQTQPSAFTVVVGGKRYSVASLKDASEKFAQTREAMEQAGEGGSSQMPTPIVEKDGQPVGYIAYNGRIFAGPAKAWTPGTPILYDPRAPHAAAKPATARRTTTRFAVGDRVTVDEGTGTVHMRDGGGHVKIRLEPDGQISKWIPLDRVTLATNRPAEALTAGGVDFTVQPLGPQTSKPVNRLRPGKDQPPKIKNPRSMNEAFSQSLKPFKGSDGGWYYVDVDQPNFSHVYRLDADGWPAPVRAFYGGAGFYHDSIPEVTFEGAYEPVHPGVAAKPTSPTKAEREGLPSAAVERKVEEEPHDVAPASSDRAPLAGTPAPDGEGAGGERPAAGGDPSRRGADGGGRVEPDSAGRPSAAGAGADAGRVGVPAERGGRPDPAERRSAGLADVARDHVIERGAELATGGERTRVAANLAAIETLKTIEGDNRAATPDEQQILAKYVGWGGLAGAFKEKHADYARLKAALTDDEYRSARASTPNAHYTSPTVISAVYDALARLGVRGPVKMLEPAAGVGHFLGLMPADLAADASRSAVELDSISGRITQKLYPNARVQVKGLQQATLAPDTFDLVLSNVPFGNYQVSDKAFKGRPKTLTSSIHNYYFAKALDLARPGGIVAFITSRYTMDAQDEGVRRYLAERARFLGAIRLPNTAFKANAGTDVVTDVIFLQRTGAQQRNPEAWVRTGKTGDHHVNDYFLANPRMVLGRMASTGSMYSDNEYTVEPTGDLAEQLKGAVALLPAAVYQVPTTKAATPDLADQLPTEYAPAHVRDGAWFLDEHNKLFVKDRLMAVPQTLSPDVEARVRGLLKVRDALRDTMQAMLHPSSSDAQVKSAQKGLNRAYDTFVQKHGYIAKRKNYLALREDPDVYTMLALEEWAPKAERPEKAAIFTKRTLRPHTPVDSVGTPKEALLVSLNETGRVNWPRMAELTGESEAHLQEALQGRVFFDPLSQTWEEADRYLSGNVKAKLAAAKAAASTEVKYALNVQALEQVQPADLEPADISIRLGAPWVPAAVIDSFAEHLGLKGLSYRYSPALAKWTVSDRFFRARYSVQNTEQWGTQRKPGNDLLLATLNLGDPIVTDTVRDPSGAEKSVVNQTETIAAREKQQAQQDEFKSWVWENPARAEKLARIYNDTMNTMVLWEPKGDHLTLPGTNPSISFRPHQKNFVWRGLQQPNALAHHVVGAGKTFAGIALALEKRRLGLARKPLVVVPNHLPQQWAKDVLRLYPAARVLAGTKADFKPENRKRFLNRIATGDWDVVILPYSHYGRIKVSDETFNEYLQHELDTLEEEIRRSKVELGTKDPSTKELEKAKLNLEAKMRTAKDEQAKDETLSFEELGIDMLVIDEAHNYKKLWFPTKMTRVAGVPTQGSQRAFDLFIKSRYLSKANPTGGTVFLTGTPISNTMAEMFVLMRYLAQATLDARGIPQFDGWAATFGEKVTAFEISPTGRGFRQKTRFARFTNMPELMQMYRAFADVQTADMLKLPTPKLKGGKAQLHAIPTSTELAGYVDGLLDRYEAVLGRKGPKPDPRDDNPLKITTDGRKAALDLRLVGLHQPEGGKVDLAGKEIADIWKRTKAIKGTQLVFADLGAPAEKKEAGKFTVYDALRDKLVELGIPKHEIAFIHDPKTDLQKQQLFEAVRAGDIRVLIGSTEKMGAGTNVQDRLVALHHLDAPWRPSDIEQREGRILRQGNLFGDKELGSKEYDPNFEVEIHTYLSEGSFDAYLWQLLESKARFILQALKGDSTSREMDDADDVVMSFGAAKAIATGNPAIMEHAKAQSDLARLEVSESNHDKRKWRLQKQVAALPEQISAWEGRETDARTILNATALPAERKDLALHVPGKGDLKGEEAVAAIMAALDRAAKGPKRQIDAYHSASMTADVGVVAGLDVSVSTTTSFVMDNPTITQHWTIAKDDFSLSRPATISSGALASLWNFIENGPRQELEKASAELATLRSSLDVAKAEVGKPFAHAETVKRLRQTIKTLEKSLNLDAQALKDEAAAAGTIVTTKEEDKADAAAEKARDEAEDADLPEPTDGDDAAPAPRKKGITLQSTILPGAAEFGEHVIEPALHKVAEQVRANNADIRRLFAPDTMSAHAVKAAGILRANLAARAQRTRRAQLTLRAVEKLMDGWSHDQSMAFWDVMEGEAPAAGLDPDTRVIAEMYRELQDAKRVELTNRNLIRSYLENYWPHEWVRGSNTVEATVRKLFGKRPLQGPESFRKRRSIPTTRYGIQELGLEPVSWNPTTQLLRKFLEMDKSITAHDIRQELKSTREAKFVAAGAKAPEGWVRFPESFGTVYGPQTFKTASGEEARIPFGRLVAGHYYGPAEVVRLLENHLSPGLAGRSALFDLYRSSGNFLNQLQLSLSAFHFMMTGMESIVSKQSLVFEQIARGQWSAAARAQAKVPIAPLLDVFRGHKALKTFYARDANAAEIDDMVGQIVNAGGGFGWDLFEHAGAPEAFMQALRGTAGAMKAGEYGRANAEMFKLTLRAVPAAVEVLMKPIMDGWVPRLKIAAFLDLAAMEMATLGDEPDLDEARRVLGAAWDSIDNRFGQLRYDNLFWNNSLKHLGMASVRALGWNIGTVREMFGVLPAQARQMGLTAGASGGGGGGKPPMRYVNTGADKDGTPHYEHQPESRLHRKTAWFLSMVMAYGLAGALLMYLLTGKRPESLKDYFFPQNGETDKNGRPVRVSIAGYFKDLYAVMHDFPGSAVTTASHKLHPLMTLIADILGNEDFFGTEIRNRDEPYLQQLTDVMRFAAQEATPISVQASQQGGSRASKVGSFLGITPAPASVSRSAMETYLHDRLPPVHRTKEQAERATERRTLREAARSTPAGGTRPATPIEHLSPADVRQTLRNAQRSSYEFALREASLDQALKAYTLATPTERRIIRAAVVNKLPGALAKTPPKDRAAVMGRFREAMQLPIMAARAGQ